MTTDDTARIRCGKSNGMLLFVRSHVEPHKHVKTFIYLTKLSNFTITNTVLMKPISFQAVCDWNHCILFLFFVRWIISFLIHHFSLLFEISRQIFLFSIIYLMNVEKLTSIFLLLLALQQEVHFIWWTDEKKRNREVIGMKISN